ncbi:hypothetical protein [Candidatus Thiosymbion oneisti]|nr:hypothetical protein [Candidatus Thiosymbion oneisti]
MANICFSVMSARTPLLHHLAERLGPLGHHIYWLCPSPFWKSWLQQRGIPEDDILDETIATRQGMLSARERREATEMLANTERTFGFTITNMILMDRFLREKAPDFSITYLLGLYVLLQRFFSGKHIEFVIGEPTLAYDLLASLTCRQMEIPYLFPLGIRIPDSRFAFFRGWNQSQIRCPNDPPEPDAALSWVRPFLARFEEEKPKPEYWTRFNQKKFFKRQWLPKGVANIVDDLRIGNSDPTRATTRYLVTNKAKELTNRLMLHINSPFSGVQAKDAPPYVLFPIHKQPESSIDVLGDFYSNQLELIRNIVRSLPASHSLFVKEHSNAIGERGVFFYSRVKRLPKVHVIDPRADSYALLGGASAVLTVAGTMAYEAGLLGKPAITFAPLFFNELPSVGFCKNIRELPGIIQHTLHDGTEPVDSDNAREKRLEFLANLYRNSYEGTFTDVLTYPEVMEDDNLSRLSLAIDDTVRARNSYWPP